MSQVFDRSKFRATKAATLKQADKETDSVVKNRSVLSGWIDIKTDGVHKLRIYPFHPDCGGDAFAEARVVHWLNVSNPERDKEGNVVNDPKTGKAKMKLGPKTIFSSKVHGDKNNKDVIEEYINFCKKLSKDNFPKDEAKQKEYLEPVNGGYGSKYKGILPKQSWIMYVDEIDVNGDKTFGRVEIGKAVKQRLNALAASEAANEPLGTDPFTDVETGRAVVITYNSKATQSQDYYMTEIDSSFDRKTQKANLYPLTDKEIDSFLKFPSLAEQYRNVYKVRDFRLALEGIKNFDDEHNMGVFQYEEFLDIVESISELYKEEAVQEDQRTGKDIDKMFTGKNKQTKVADVEREPDVFDDMDRQELKDYCKEERTGIIVINKMSDDEIRTKVRDWYNATQEEQEGEDEAEEVVAKAETTLKNKLSKVEESEQEEEVEEEDDGLPWKKDGTDRNQKTSTVVEKKEVAKSIKSAADRVAAIRNNLKKK